MKAFYDLWYRVGTPPWVGHARSTLVEMVQTGDLLPGRTIDLGCGEGDIAISGNRSGFCTVSHCQGKGQGERRRC